MMKLPKPVFFNTFSLQHFPDYALTKKAIKAGHITEEELGDWPMMMRRTTENWSFIPKLKKLKKLKTTRIQMLNNIIWMMCWNHVGDSLVKYAVFGNSLGSKIMFHYLNIKSVIVWRIFGIGGFIHKNISQNKLIIYPYIAIKMFFSGNCVVNSEPPIDEQTQSLTLLSRPPLASPETRKYKPKNPNKSNHTPGKGSVLPSTHRKRDSVPAKRERLSIASGRHVEARGSSAGR